MLKPILICVLCLLTAGRGIADEKQVSVFLLIGAGRQSSGFAIFALA
ncbi:MAG: hypothetical protein LW816_18115 [Planctomyces sp.]|nr:hypothetical protein [Planctomyces sp.]